MKFEEATVFDAISVCPEKFGVIGWDGRFTPQGIFVRLAMQHGGTIYLHEFTRLLNTLLESGAKFCNENEGEVVVTTNEDGEGVLVSRQDEDHKILKVIWEKK